MKQKETVKHYQLISKDRSEEFLDRMDPNLLQKQPFLADEIRLALDLLFQERPECIVDLGCGTGWYLPVLKEYCRNIIAIEISEDLLELARGVISSQGLKGVNVMHYDGYTLPFEDGSINCIFEWDVLHHVEDIGKLLCEVARVIAKEGIFVGIEPNVFNPLMAVYHIKRKHEWNAFVTNRIKMKKMLSKSFEEVNLYSNNIAVSYNNEFYRKIIKLINPMFTRSFPFNLFSLRYVFIAKRTNNLH